MTMNYSFKFLKVFFLTGILLLPGWNVMGQTKPIASTKTEVKVWSISNLMASLSSVGKGTAIFKEERYISFLSEPLISKGNLRFQSPDYLFKHTESPKDERLVVFEDEVTITNLEKGLQQSFSLNDFPQLRGLLDGIRYTLAGNIEELNKSYKLTLQGSQADWQIYLSPKLKTMQELISNINILGKGQNIYKLEIFESNGDRTIMHIEPNQK
ncbi:MAG: LolA-related protein [Nitrospinales bacterium]